MGLKLYVNDNSDLNRGILEQVYLEYLLELVESLSFDLNDKSMDYASFKTKWQLLTNETLKILAEAKMVRKYNYILSPVLEQLWKEHQELNKEGILVAGLILLGHEPERIATLMRTSVFQIYRIVNDILQATGLDNRHELSDYLRTKVDLSFPIL